MAEDKNEFGYTGGGNYEPIPEGKYDAVLHAIIGLGRQKRKPYKGKPKQPAIQLKFVFEIPGVMRSLEDGSEIPNVISKNINMSDSIERGGFAAMLRALGEKPTEANITGYMKKEALEKLLGRKVVLMIAHFGTDDGDRPFVKDVFELDPRIQPQPQPHREPLYFNPRTPDIKAFKDVITPFTRDVMMNALDADQFPKELHEAYRDLKEQEAKDAKEGNKQQEEPWEGSTEAIE